MYVPIILPYQKVFISLSQNMINIFLGASFMYTKYLHFKSELCLLMVNVKIIVDASLMINIKNLNT